MEILNGKNKYLTIEDCSKYIGRSIPSIYKLVADGDLKSVKPEILIRDQKGEIYENVNVTLSRYLITKTSADTYLDFIKKHQQDKGRQNVRINKSKKRGKQIKATYPNGMEQTFVSQTELLNTIDIPISRLKRFLDSGEKTNGFKFETHIPTS